MSCTLLPSSMMRSAVLLFTALIVGGAPLSSQTPATMSDTVSSRVPQTARGTFEVRVTPQPAEDTAGSSFARFLLEKEIAGDLAGSSRGQMLSAGTPVEGSAGYVALELVSGTLHGRRGTFVLQHVGHMTRDSVSMTITVLPDSGTGELAGITGRFLISIVDGKHSYVLEYSLGSPASR
jgi:hypothetical protein